jgi:Na+/proline symporter
MATLTTFETYLLFGLFGLSMIALVWIRTRREGAHTEGFLAADRNVSSWGGAFSIAVSWVWAPAIFICALQAYTKGLAGIFWFTAPNILCFFVFAVIAVRLRKLMPDGYTLPDFIWQRFGGSKPVHLAFLVIAFGYQLAAIIINAVAGGTLLHLASGIDIQGAIVGMIGVALAYSLLGGLKASIFTDVMQMSMILIFGFVLVPWAIFASGGVDTITQGLAGITGEHGSIFHPWVAYTMGIPMTISLIAGPISDQMFYQRALAVKKENIVPVFVRGGLIFGLVPIVLSLLGFVGVTLANTQGLMINDPQMVGPMVIAAVLPKFALYLFILMAFAGLCSTMDSAFCGMSALGSVDLFKRYKNKAPSDKDMLRAARLFMIAGAVLGGGIALMQPQLLWVFFIYGALASAGLVPTIAALFWTRITAKDVFVATILSIVIATPLSIYANITENPHLIVLSSVASIGVSALVCGLSALMNPKVDQTLVEAI